MAIRPLTAIGKAMSSVVVLIAALVFFALPLILITVNAASGNAPTGFARGFEGLAAISLQSILVAAIPALIAASFACLCSCMGSFSHRFRAIYRGWLLLLLFTNPVFFVFGFSVLFSNFPPLLAVGTATAYILLPFLGLLIQAAVDDFPADNIRAARSLGSSAIGVAWRHILPGIRGKLSVAIVLGAVYAMGFYLLPSFVGLGRVTTIGTTIDHAANRLGDWNAASQLCLVALAAQIVIVIAWLLSGIRWRRTRYAQQ